MTRFAKTILLMGASIIALSACSSDGKGPGPLGSKNDIVVQNNGLPGAKVAQQTVTAENGITSTVENVTPNPAAEVAAGEPLPAPDAIASAAGEQMTQSEPLPNNDPAVDEAARKVAEQKTPGVTTAATPMNDTTASSTAPVTDTTPSDIVAKEPVAQQNTVPTPTTTPATATTAPVTTAAPVPNTSVYPAPTPAPQPVAAPTPVPTGTPVTATATPTTTPVYPAATPVAASSVKLADPSVIKAVQASLRLKGIYKGAETGKVDSEFLNALTVYQSQNKLPVGGLNAETLISLGIAQ